VNPLKKTKPVGISLPTNLLRLIDERRGKIPRSTYVADILQDALKEVK